MVMTLVDGGGGTGASSAALKAKKARMEAARDALVGHLIYIDDKLAFLGSGDTGSLVGDKYDEEREQEIANLKTLEGILDTKRDFMVGFLNSEITSVSSEILAAEAKERAALEKKQKKISKGVL